MADGMPSFGGVKDVVPPLYESNDDVDHNFMIGYGGWLCITMPSPVEYEDCSSPPSKGEKDGSSPSSVGNKDISSSNVEVLNGRLFPVVSASVTRSLSVPTANSYYMPHEDGNDSAKSLIRTGYGVYSFSGEMTFELTNGFLDFLSVNIGNSYGSTFKRNSIFHIQMFDGENTCTLYNCVWTNFSISCNPNALVTASISFVSNNGYMDDLYIVPGDLRTGYYFDDTDLHVPYWQTGLPGATSVSVSFERDVAAVYLNNSFKMASYLRPGIINMGVNINMLELFDYVPGNMFSVKIGRKRITLSKPVLSSHSYHMSSLNDIGEKSYSWNSIPINSSDTAFVIEDEADNKK